MPIRNAAHGLYHGSKFKSGSKDSLKREKPSYSIRKFRVNVAVRAADLDTNDVLIEADDVGAYGQSFILSLKNRKWMKASNFAALLNTMGQARAKYGHLGGKKIERAGELHYPRILSEESYNNTRQDENDKAPKYPSPRFVTAAVGR